MRRLNVYVLLIASLLAAEAMAGPEAAAPKTVRAPTTNFIGDDDGGVVQIVPVGLTPSGPGKTANSAPVMKSIQQLSVFLGSGWAEQGARSREATLADLAGHVHLAALYEKNVSVLSTLPSVEALADLKEPTNDGTIQSTLVRMLESGALPAPDASTVFVVFLAPELKLTVGGHTAGVHFAAYHNLIHVAAGQLCYVVVPFNDSASQQATAASLAMVDTVYNPASY